MPRGPGTGAGQGRQGSVSLGRGRVQDAEAETQSRALGVYGPAASEHSKCRAEGNVDAESVPGRGSGKTARRRGLCHDSYRPAGRGQEERVRPWEMRWPGKPPRARLSSLPQVAPPPRPKSHSSLQPSSLLRPSQPKIPNPPPSSPASRTRGPRLLPPPPCLRLAPQSARSTCRWQKLLSLKSPVINHLIAKPNYSQSSNKPRSDRPPGHCPLCLECPSLLLHMAT